MSTKRVAQLPTVVPPAVPSGLASTLLFDAVRQLTAHLDAAVREAEALQGTALDAAEEAASHVTLCGQGPVGPRVCLECGRRADARER